MVSSSPFLNPWGAVVNPTTLPIPSSVANSTEENEVVEVLTSTTFLP